MQLTNKLGKVADNDSRINKRSLPFSVKALKKTRTANC